MRCTHLQIFPRFSFHEFFDQFEKNFFNDNNKIHIICDTHVIFTMCAKFYATELSPILA